MKSAFKRLVAAFLEGFAVSMIAGVGLGMIYAGVQVCFVGGILDIIDWTIASVVIGIVKVLISPIIMFLVGLAGIVLIVEIDNWATKLRDK